MYRAGDILAVYTHSHTRLQRVNTNINCTKVNTHIHTQVECILMWSCRHAVNICAHADKCAYARVYTYKPVQAHLCIYRCRCANVYTHRHESAHKRAHKPACAYTCWPRTCHNVKIQLLKKEHIVLHKYMLNSLNKSTPTDSTTTTPSTPHYSWLNTSFCPSHVSGYFCFWCQGIANPGQITNFWLVHLETL